MLKIVMVAMNNLKVWYREQFTGEIHYATVQGYVYRKGGYISTADAVILTDNDELTTMPLYDIHPCKDGQG